MPPKLGGSAWNPKRSSGLRDMDFQKRSGPAAFADAAPGQMGSAYVRHSPRPPLKWRRVLRAFYDGKTLNRFEAERLLHDHCLHSTVSTIQAKGVTILRKTERVPGYMGISTECCRYWLAPHSRQRARELLEGRRAIPARETRQNESCAIQGVIAHET